MPPRACQVGELGDGRGGGPLREGLGKAIRPLRALPWEGIDVVLKGPWWVCERGLL